MSNEEFWEEDPQLYWSYRIFYLKNLEIESKNFTEKLKYSSWLQGNMNCVANSISLGNAFSKTKHEFPKYNEMFNNSNIKNEKLTKNEINIKVQEQFNAWARY